MQKILSTVVLLSGAVMGQWDWCWWDCEDQPEEDNWWQIDEDDLRETMASWEDEWSGVMDEFEEKFEDLGADFNWDNSTNWNETDWQSLREEMASNWNITWNDTEWQSFQDDMSNMRNEFGNWTDEDMAEFEDKMEQWSEDLDAAFAEVEESWGEWDSWFWGEMEDKDWEDEWNQAMADFEEKMEMLGDYEWHNATAWNESDWQSLRGNLTQEWNMNFTDEEWQSWQQDMIEMQGQWDNWSEEDMQEFEDKMDEWLGDFDQMWTDMEDVNWEEELENWEQEWQDGMDTWNQVQDWEEDMANWEAEMEDAMADWEKELEEIDWENTWFGW